MGIKKPHIAHNLFYLIQAARFRLIIFFHLLKKDHFCWFCDILKKVPETRVPNTIPSKPPPLWWKVEQTGQTGVNFNWGWLPRPLCLISLHIQIVLFYLITNSIIIIHIICNNIIYIICIYSKHNYNHGHNILRLFDT